MKLLCFALLLIACSHAAPTQTSETAAAPAQAPAAAFETVRAVLQSPRCVNCHPAGDVPLQGDDLHLHQPLIKRGAAGTGVAGLSCTACHGTANAPASYGPHMPPGVAKGWKLPPAEHRMVFQGLSSAALCEQIKDPKQNGGKSMADLVEHVSHDAIVLWGWSPGTGRKPVPISHEEFESAFKTWAAAGAPCGMRTTSNP